MADSKALIYSDEPSTSRIWALLVTDLACRPIAVNSLALAIDALQASAPDLVVVDVTSRAVNGVEVCAALRERTSNPILLLTPINNESHTLEAYQAGVDECIIKPISPALFLAKAAVWLRHSGGEGTETLGRLVLGDRVLEPTTHELVHADGRSIRLSKQEFQLLHLLMGHPNRVLSNEEIIEQIWGFHGEGYSTLVKNLVYRLRRKIAAGPEDDCGIVSVPGGYLCKV
jgi:two-component system, OmpR family, response regulator MtrA